MRRRIEQAPPGRSGDLVYHAEPFDVANDIMQKDLDVSNYQAKYDGILARHNW